MGIDFIGLGCLPFTQTKRVEIVCKKQKTIKFNVVGERLFTMSVQIS